MSLCSSFIIRVAKFERTLADCEAILQEYGKSGDSEVLAEARQCLASLAQEREEFMQKDYAPAVRNLLRTWQGADGIPRKLPDDAQVKGTGKVDIILDASHPDFFPSDTTAYFPHLIERIEGYLYLNYGTEVNHIGYVKHLFIRQRLGLQMGRESVFSRLDEIGLALVISSQTPIESFRALFPRLKRIGGNVRLTLDHAHLRDEIIRLQQKGELIVEGEILISLR